VTHCIEPCDDLISLRSFISELIMARALIGLLFLLVASGCSITKDVTVPRIEVGEPAGMAQVPGRYAALLQGGRWKLTGSSEKRIGLCGGYKFNFDVDDAFEGAARTSLTSLFESVDFVEVALTPLQFRERGYAAQVIVRQGDIAADIKFIRFITQGATTLHIGIDLRDATGLIHRQDFEGSGYSSETSDLSCAAGATIEAKAFQNALRNAMQASVSTIRNQLSKPRSQ
jgi:hypothetical protein